MSHLMRKVRQQTIGWCIPIASASLIVAPALNQTAWAQERSATREEIVGNWEMIPIPQARQPQIISNPWPAACQWYGYSSSGRLFNYNRSPGPCEKVSSKELDTIAASLPPVVNWKFEIASATGKGVLVVTRTDVPNYVEYWNVHIATQTGPEYAKSDLVLYFMKIDMVKKQGAVAWIRHLRRLL